MDCLRDNPELLAKLIAMAKVAVAAEPENEEWEFLLIRLQREQNFANLLEGMKRRNQSQE